LEASDPGDLGVHIPAPGQQPTGRLSKQEVIFITLTDVKMDEAIERIDLMHPMRDLPIDKALPVLGRFL
jgi:hypothetical protein